MVWEETKRLKVHHSLNFFKKLRFYLVSIIHTPTPDSFVKHHIIMAMPHKWPFTLPPRSQRRYTVTATATPSVRNEDIVIVGAGIAGLATAVALQRVGISSVVLEQAESLRTGGTSLTFFKNGWKVFDAIGVGAELRPQFLEIQGMTVKSEDGRELRSFRFKDEDPSQEVRAVERRTLLETLANRLPPSAISFSSKLKTIAKTPNDDHTNLTLEDDSVISAKAVFSKLSCRSRVLSAFSNESGGEELSVPLLIERIVFLWGCKVFSRISRRWASVNGIGCVSSPRSCAFVSNYLNNKM